MSRRLEFVEVMQNLLVANLFMDINNISNVNC